jgi:hypothetical protein
VSPRFVALDAAQSAIQGESKRIVPENERDPLVRQKEVLETYYPDAKKVVLVMDNLNTHVGDNHGMGLAYFW